MLPHGTTGVKKKSHHKFKRFFVFMGSIKLDFFFSFLFMLDVFAFSLLCVTISLSCFYFHFNLYLVFHFSTNSSILLVNIFCGTFNIHRTILLRI